MSPAQGGLDPVSSPSEQRREQGQAARADRFVGKRQHGSQRLVQALNRGGRRLGLWEQVGQPAAEFRRQPQQADGGEIRVDPCDQGGERNGRARVKERC